jgi:hypothetical protein
MKSRIALLVVGAFLLVVPLAVADAGAPISSLFTPEGSACGVSSSVAPLPGLNPFAPQDKALTCGACSGVCSGATVNSICAGGSFPKHCQLQSSCPTGGWTCICTNLPPP